MQQPTSHVCTVFVLLTAFQPNHITVTVLLFYCHTIVLFQKRCFHCFMNTCSALCVCWCKNHGKACLYKCVCSGGDKVSLPVVICPVVSVCGMRDWTHKYLFVHVSITSFCTLFIYFIVSPPRALRPFSCDLSFNVCRTSSFWLVDYYFVFVQFHHPGFFFWLCFFSFPVLRSAIFCCMMSFPDF
jgi:hypothetical protein